MKLWKFEHPYYMAEGGQISHYDSWAEYLSDWKDSDGDLNLLWRWDFIVADNGKISLDIFYILQRKGYTYSCHIAKIDPKDEAKIKNFLKKKAKKIADIWAPFLEMKK